MLNRKMSESIEFKSDNLNIGEEIKNNSTEFFNEKCGKNDVELVPINNIIKDKLAESLYIKENNNSIIEIESSQFFHEVSLNNNDLNTEGDSNTKLINSEPYFLIDDCGIKKDSYGEYRIYKILEISNTETIIKCERRYNHFDKFYQKIQKKFPWIIIPELVEKIYLDKFNKFKTIDNEKYQKRRTQLNHFLNYIFNHDTLRTSVEFRKFIRDPNFDHGYFSKEDSFYHINEFPESIMNTDGFFNKITDIFQNSLTSINNKDGIINNNIFQIEEDCKNKREFYDKALTNLKNIRKNISDFISSVNFIGKNFNEFMEDLNYLKDVNFLEKNLKKDLVIYRDISKDIGIIHSQFYIEKLKDFEDEIDAFIYILSGLCKAINRYEEFLVFYKDIIRKNKKNREKTESNNLDLLIKEEEKLNGKNQKFQLSLNDEIKIFNHKYDKKFFEILKKFEDLLKRLSSDEFQILERIHN